VVVERVLCVVLEQNECGSGRRSVRRTGKFLCDSITRLVRGNGAILCDRGKRSVRGTGADSV
jgi:hypothetical protein